MAKAVIKTTENDASVEDFINGLADEKQRADTSKIVEMMGRITGEKPKMWGASMIGFGSRTITSPSGRVVDWHYVGFAPRKGNLSLYVLNQSAAQAKLLEKLGPHKTGLGCLYIKRLSDIDPKVLEKLIAVAFKEVKKTL